MLNQSVDQRLLICRAGATVISSELKAVIYLVMRAGLCKKKRQREKKEEKKKRRRQTKTHTTNPLKLMGILPFQYLNYAV